MRTIKTRHFTGTTDNTVTKREIENRKVARRAAAEGMVLLKNEGILPLKEGTKIALYGVGASRTIKGGTGSGDVNERETVSIYQGMKNAGFEITTEDWIKDFDEKYQAARYAWREKQRLQNWKIRCWAFLMFTLLHHFVCRRVPLSHRQMQTLPCIFSAVLQEKVQTVLMKQETII